MDKCPKCKQWTLELSISESALKCYNMECDYENHVNVDEYLEKHNALPLLARSLTLNGYHQRSAPV
jgi:hypothetical protein